MSIESTCPNCHRNLRVADEHAGKQAKCPACDTIYTVPATGAGSSTTADHGTTPLPSAPIEQWQLKTPEGQTFGPVTRTELDNWVSQGRITSECQILCEGDDQWQWASDIYPSLAGAAASSGNRFAQSSDESRAAGQASNPYATPNISIASTRTPHRGGLILTLGILSLVVCGFLGIPAWIMGAADLKEIRAGRMDVAGLGTTQAGMVLGIVACVLMIILIPLSCMFGALGGM